MSGSAPKTKLPGVSYDVFDIVVVPRAFADRDIVRKRPALVLTPFASFGEATGVCTMPCGRK